MEDEQEATGTQVLTEGSLQGCNAVESVESQQTFPGNTSLPSSGLKDNPSKALG
jgi:hypothetical protein